MGRPLKIAKAQVITVTATTATTNIVTTSADLNALGIIAGMRIQVASTVGGLTGGTQYWILQVLTANTFTVSATQLSQNVNFTPVTLTTTTGQTVKATVQAVDTGFQNPDSAAQSGGTSTNPGASYGVVGGNTGIYSSQVLAQVAIGINGTGTLYSAGTANTSAVLYGQGTDLANLLSTGSAIQVAVANVNGQTDYVDVGFASSTIGAVTVAVANTTASGNVIGTSGNAQTLGLNQPVKFDASFGNLVAGTTYFVKTIANAAAFTVSATQGGIPKALTSNASVTANAIQDTVTLSSNAMVVFNNASFVYANDEAGYIVRQKGKQKYLVTGATSGLTAQCYTANVANAALTPNTMSIVSTNAGSSNVYVQSLSDYNTLLFNNSEANIQNATPVTATFGTAYAANTYGGQPLPIVTINNA
jgi:hypothetical protein